MIPALIKVAHINIKYKKKGPHNRCLHRGPTWRSYGPAFNVIDTYMILFDFFSKAVYIWETSSYIINKTMNEWTMDIVTHRNDIKHNKNKLVAKHFNKPDHKFKNLEL